MDSEGQRLQTAVEAGDFGVIAELAAAYRQSVARQLKRAAPAQRRAILQQARERLNWCLQLIKVRRAHIARRLQAAEESAYAPPKSPVHSWEIEG